MKTAYVVGHSISALIALQLALAAPDLVHSLALLELPLRMVPSGKASFERNVLPVISAYRSGDRQKAVESFGGVIFGPNWQSFVEKTVPEWERYSDWADVQLERSEPEGPATVGQTIYFRGKAIGRTWRFMFKVEEINRERHQLDLHVSLPLGLQEKPHIACSPIDATTCRVQYG